MSYCGISEMAAQVEILVSKDAVRALNAIYETSSPGVTVHEVAIGFGRVDLIAWIKTSLESDARIEHPTMRLARWVNKVRDLNYVNSTVTTILVHDPEHDKRHRRALARAGQEPKESGTKARRRPSRKRRAPRRK
jgi:hypothetical protein